MSTSPNPKIIDLINEKKADGILTSLEYFPPRTETGVKVSFVFNNDILGRSRKNVPTQWISKLLLLVSIDFNLSLNPRLLLSNKNN